MIDKSIRLSSTRQYKILKGMKQRCYNPNALHYDRYGARGITICDEWLGPDGAKAFYDWSVSHGYSDNLTIDRIDNDEGYSPDNCVWVTRSFNSSNWRFCYKLMHVVESSPTFEAEYLIRHARKLSKEDAAELKDFYKWKRKKALKL